MSCDFLCSVALPHGTVGCVIVFFPDHTDLLFLATLFSNFYQQVGEYYMLLAFS